ncbi:ATP-binding cassette domain-containing protein [Arthrobacter sp. ERGS1:01]|uniref:ATP-binding cassette domain-containing protein n=1 Tax=Arthrobacter sp. ERGS1:01 TaxID=1704044 RepID=UPI0006B6801A|nr:ABC transporter ATP-binding protein [Arthrobacter sp. ERGS1:01]
MSEKNTAAHQPASRRLWSVTLHILGLGWRVDKRSTVIILVLIGVGAFLNSLAALSQRWIVDAAGANIVSGVVMAALVGGAVVGLGGAADWIQRYRQGHLIDLVEVSVNDEILQTAGSIPTLAHLERSDYLDKVALLRRSVRDLSSGWWAAASAAGALVSVAMSVILLMRVHPLLGLLAPVALVPLWAARKSHVFEAAARTKTAESERYEAALHRLLLDPGAAKEIQLSGSATLLDDAARQASAHVIRTRAQARTKASLLNLLAWSSYAAAYIGALVLLAHLVLEGRANIGDVMLLITLASTLRYQIWAIVEEYTRIAEARLATEHYLWLMDYAELQRHRGTHPVPETMLQGISFTDVSFSYPGTDVQVLSGINLDFPAGSTVALVGVNGAGKTTLVKLLTGMYTPDTGSITVDGRSLDDLHLADWRSRTSGAFQDFVNFQLPVGTAIGVGDLPNSTDTGAISAAARASGADAVVERLADGYETQLGLDHDGVQLSQGQAQKVALARGLMRGNPLLRVLDEPTAALDPQSEDELYRRFVDQATGVDGMVTILVSHRFSTVRMADEIVVISRGTVAERGTHAELMGNDSDYARLYLAQASGYT